METSRFHNLFAFLDWVTVAFAVVNILDMSATLIGIYFGKVEETTDILETILESYGFSGFILVKLSMSVLLIIPLFLKRFWKSDIWTKSISAGFGIVSILLFPYYLILIVKTVRYILW